MQAHHEELMEKEKKVEQTNLDPELEYEIAHANDMGKAEEEKAMNHHQQRPKVFSPGFKHSYLLD